MGNVVRSIGSQIGRNIKAAVGLHPICCYLYPRPCQRIYNFSGIINPLKWPRIYTYILEKARFYHLLKNNPENSAEKPGYISLKNVNSPLFTFY